MYKLYPYFTNDGSTGLFSPDADDIYHSTYGALTEAYEKFILPLGIYDFLKKNNEIKVLDICFGIGYNTKSLINKILEINYSETIGTNNIKHIDKLDTDNKKLNIFIHAIDTDKYLANLSPFFIANKKMNSKEQLSFKQEKINRMLSEQTNPKFRLKKESNILLLQHIFKSIDAETEAILYAKEYSKYFDKYMVGLYEFYKTCNSNLSPYKDLRYFLHNIYYNHISNSHKNALNYLKLLNFKFKLSIMDARQAVKADENIYNFIFLDAFTPVKCPCLWTIDFFKMLYEHLDDNGILLTYSNSALVRNAFLNAGFNVGKIYSESMQKYTGTIAVKNKSLIKHELSEYDLGLMKTKAGIFYRDENFTLDNEAIIAAHKKEVETSELMSSSKYIKSRRKQ